MSPYQAEGVGKVINIFGAMANSPALMEMYDLVETHLANNSNLDNEIRQAIHLTVAAVNDCGYCQAAYTGTAKAAGFQEEETIEIRRGSLSAHPKLDALLNLSRQIADNRGMLTTRCGGEPWRRDGRRRRSSTHTPKWSVPSSPTTSTTGSAPSSISPNPRRLEVTGIIFTASRLETPGSA